MNRVRRPESDTLVSTPPHRIPFWRIETNTTAIFDHVTQIKIETHLDFLDRVKALFGSPIIVNVHRID